MIKLSNIVTRLAIFAGTTLIMAATPALANSSAEIPATTAAASNAPDDVTAIGPANTEFRALFSDWRKLDRIGRGNISIPSRMPVEGTRMTSDYGMRSDPFRGNARRHSGVDLAGPLGTPIHATADGIVSKAAWFGGYGRFVEIEHGGAFQTRYGHMSRLNVTENQHVKKGEIIGYMGSSGRSTGSHLHYEVRINGEAVNPIPYMHSEQYVESRQNDTLALASGGPDE